MLTRLLASEEKTPNLLFLVSVVILAGSLLYMLFVPSPSVAGVASGRERSRKQIQEDIDRASEQAERAEKAVQPRLWKGDSEQITAQVLGQITQLTSARKVKLTAFRPQRVQTIAGVSELPYNLSLAGSYPDILAIAAALDAPGSRLALRLIQVAASDTASSAVTATMSVTAYREPTTDAAAPKKREEANAKN